LWVVATNPDSDGLVAIVSLTSLKGAKDQTVVIHAGEHPFVKWETCALYALAEVTSIDKLCEYIDCGLARMHYDVSNQLLALILDGFTASDYTKNRVRRFVKEYKQSRIDEQIA
jgi:hypothetical protein